MTEVKKDGDIALKHVSLGKWFVLTGFVLVVAALLLWIFLGEISSVLRVTGILADDKKPQSVFVGEGGYVVQQNYWAGDIVKKDEVLFKYIPYSAVEGTTTGSLSLSELRECEVSIKSPYEGYIMNTPVGVGEQIDSLGTVADLEIIDDERSVLAVINYNDKGYIKEGMPVRIKPYVYPAEKYGYMTGKVSHIHSDFINREELNEYLGSDELVNLVTEGDIQDRYLVCITLDCDENLVPVWTGASEGEENNDIRFGMICELEIITQVYHPYEFLFK